jgi:hypothetical protein
MAWRTALSGRGPNSFAVELAEGPDRPANAGRLRRRLAVFDIVGIGECEIGQEQLVDGEIRPGSRCRGGRHRLLEIHSTMVRSYLARLSVRSDPAPDVGAGRHRLLEIHSTMVRSYLARLSGEPPEKPPEKFREGEWGSAGRKRG